jgi:hypothetical protein
MLSLLGNKSSSRRQPGDFRTDVEVPPHGTNPWTSKAFAVGKGRLHSSGSLIGMTCVLVSSNPLPISSGRTSRSSISQNSRTLTRAMSSRWYWWKRTEWSSVALTT